MGQPSKYDLYLAPMLHYDGEATSPEVSTGIC